MKKARLWLAFPQPRWQRGAVRLAVVGLTLATFGIGAATLLRHAPVVASSQINSSQIKSSQAVLSAHSPILAAKKKDCGCNAKSSPSSAGIKGTRFHYAKQTDGTFRLAQSVGPDGSGADVIIPEESRYNVLVVAPGEQVELATTSPLPTGTGAGAGHWVAVFGDISDNGNLYTAPNEVPPYGLDEISYSGLVSGPNIQLMVRVEGMGSPQAAAPKSGPRLAVEGNQARFRLASGTTISNCASQAVASAPISQMKKVPASIRGHYAQTVRWLNQQNSPGGASLRLAQATTPDGSGYLLPAWVDDGNVQVYTPVMRANGQTRQPPVVCSPSLPMLNALPPHPCPTCPYNCQPGAPYDMPDDGLPHWQTGTPKVSDFTNIGHVVPVPHGGGECEKDYYDVQRRMWSWARVRYVDHYKCANSGRDWIYINTTMCTQLDIASEYRPQIISDCYREKRDGQPNWKTPSSCREIRSRH